MKAKITDQSAFLLIENNKTDWPTLPGRQDRDFDELQTISGENLISVFCALVPTSFDIEGFVSEFKDLRIKRNKLVHSTGVSDLEHQYVISKILSFLSHFYSPTKWIDIFREKFTSDPTFGYWDADVESAYFYGILDFIEKSTTKGELNNYLPYDIKSRRYCCPECTYWLNKHANADPEPRWTFLTPNEPTSTKVECLICGVKYDVQREDCKNEPCKGNVIYDGDLCLTCNTHN